MNYTQTKKINTTTESNEYDKYFQKNDLSKTETVTW